MTQPERTSRSTLIVDQAPVIIPETPAGQMLEAFLEAFNSADQETIARFISDNYTTHALQGMSPDERARWDVNLHRDTGGFTLAHLGASTALEMTAYAKTRLVGDWFLIQITVSSEASHRVLAITTRPSGRPTTTEPHLPLGDESIIERLNKVLDRLTKADMFSGALLIAREGKPIFEYACGQANQAYEIPNKVDTRFNVGSLCKSFTAVAVAQLAGQGMLSFQDPLSKFLPDYPPEVADKITLHHLLTHTSGLGHYWNERFEAARARLRSVADYIPLFMDDPLQFEPGEKYAYSNAGYILLGRVVEVVSKQDYFNYVRKHVYHPAGMKKTDAYELDRSTPDLATGYTYNGLDDRPEFGARRNNLFMHVVKGGPAGGAFSTVHDLLSFSKALLSHKLLSLEITETVLQPKVRISRSVYKQYSYGFMMTFVNGRRIIGHSGTFPGVGARLDMYLDHGYTVAILSNYDPYVTQALGNKLREWIAGY